MRSVGCGVNRRVRGENTRKREHALDIHTASPRSRAAAIPAPRSAAGTGRPVVPYVGTTSTSPREEAAGRSPDANTISATDESAEMFTADSSSIDAIMPSENNLPTTSSARWTGVQVMRIRRASRRTHPEHVLDGNLHRTRTPPGIDGRAVGFRSRRRRRPRRRERERTARGTRFSASAHQPPTPEPPLTDILLPHGPSPRRRGSFAIASSRAITTSSTS